MVGAHYHVYHTMGTNVNHINHSFKQRRFTAELFSTIRDYNMKVKS